MANRDKNIIIEEAAQVFQAEVTGVDKLAGDASDRSFYRIRLKGKPESVILMELASPHPGPELPYINIGRYFQKIGLPVPEIYHYNCERGFLFLEDRGQRSLFDDIQTDGFQEYYYRQALDILLILQDKAREDNHFPVFDEEKFLWELDFFVEHTIRRYRKISLGKTDKRVFREEFKRLIQPLLAQPKVLTHRDFHSRNLMVNNKRLTVIDFQDARWGPCQYDLVSLLRDSYVKLKEGQVSEFITYYLEKRRQGYDTKAFRRLFDLMSVQRNLKAIGTFTSQFNLYRNNLYLRFIPTTAAYVRGNCKKYPELERLGELLSTYGVIES